MDAVREAAENLVNHFFLFSNLNKTAEVGTERSSVPVSPEIFQTPIDKLELSPRTLNCLKRAHITKVGEVLEMADDDLLKIRNFGEKSLTELREKLAERGIGFQNDGGSTLQQGASEGVGAAVAETATPVGGLSAQDIRDLLGTGDGPAAPADLPGDTAGWTMEDDPEDDEDDTEGDDDEEEED